MLQRNPPFHLLTKGKHVHFKNTEYQFAKLTLLTKINEIIWIFEWAKVC